MSAIVEELFSFNVYKRSQGRIVRQVTFAAIALALLIGIWKMVWLFRAWPNFPTAACYGVPAAIGAIGLWGAYRIVNMPMFADFLIAVEAEMNKVSWPSWSELVRWTIVVIIVIFAIGFLLFGFDLFWVKIFTWMGMYGGKP